jgi:P-type E1-E2 ATPase
LPDGRAVPIFCADKVKEEIKSLLKQLYPSKTVLLSGDSQKAVQATASYCGFDKCYWQMSPQQKHEYINKLRQEGEVVCMIGDGINDAPALSAAQVGISVLSATDISIQTSDIFLTSDKLSILPSVQLLAQQAAGIVNQNLFWAFFYNIIGIGLAFFGWLSPLFAAFAMIMSSLIVILNSQRVSK